MRTVRSIFSAATLAGVIGAGLVVAGAAPANAVACGYSEKQEHISSSISITLPIVGTVDPFGGNRMVAHWGNCTKGNQKIKVNTKRGPKDLCVTPGDTRLGLSRNDQRISGAVAIGKC